MDTFTYRPLLLPESATVYDPADISPQIAETLEVYDIINGRNYSPFDPINFGRAVELLEEFDEQECHVAIDQEEGKTAGVINFGAMPHKGWLWITGIAVSPDYQRLGIGRNLLLQAERSAQQQAVGALALRSVEAVIPYYERHGFEIIEDGSQPVMRRHLTS